MKSTDIAAEVASLQGQRDALKKRLDTLVRRFQDDFPSAAEPWIRREVERCIENHPDSVEALGVERLRALKSKVNTLIASLPEIVKRETSDEKYWPHYRAPETSGYGRDKDEPFFNEAFRNVIGNLGAILDEFGLLTEPKGYVPSWEKTDTDKFRFAINPGLDALSTIDLNEFGQVYKEYRALADKLENKQKELAKAKARELWESA